MRLRNKRNRSELDRYIFGRKGEIMATKQNKTTRRTAASGGQAQRLGIFGASGCGKTTKARELTAGLGRVIYFDPLGEWGRDKGVKPFVSLDKLKQALRRNFGQGFRFAFLPAFGEEETQLQDLSYYLATLQSGYGTQHTAQLTLVVDELDQSFPTGSMQKNRKNGFGFLCCRGRHFGINLIGISQRMHLVDNVFRANCSGVYLYRHAEPADIDIGVRMLGREYRDAFQKLNNYEYFFKSGQKIIKK